jgi:hypothetical protein
VASGYATRREAEAALAYALNEVHTGRYVEPTTMTVGQFLCDEWLPASAARVRARPCAGTGSSSTPTPCLGFVLATAAIVLGYAQSGRACYARAATTWRCTACSPLPSAVSQFATLAGVAALLVDREHATNRFTLALLMGTSLVAVARLCRMLYVLSGVIAIAITDPSRDPGEP